MRFYDTKHGADAMLVVLTVLWGSTFYVSQVIMNDISPILLTTIRFSLAALLCLIGCRSFSIRTIPFRWAIILGALFSVAISLQNISLNLLPAGRGAFIAYSYAIFIPPLQLLLLKRKIEKSSAIGIVCAIIGVAFLSLDLSSGALQISWGEIAMILSSLIFPFYIIYLDKLPQLKNFWLFMFWVFATVAVINIPFIFLFETPRFSLSSRGIIALAYLVSLGSTVSLSIQVRFQNRTSPVRATTIYALEPVFAALIAFMLGAQVMSSREILGGALVVGGVVIMELIPLLRERKSALSSKKSV